MNTPAVSIVMSVYNGAKHLREAIESILNQTYSDFEFIIINDGSSDESGTIIDEYARSDSRICAIHQLNKGLTSSLNNGIALARAPLIARMDDDDISLPQRLMIQTRFMENNPNVGILGAQIISIDDQGDPLKLVNAQIFPRLLQRGQPIKFKSIIVAHPAVIMRRNLILKVGEYREIFKHCEDTDLWLRAIQYCDIANCDETLLKYRRSHTQVSFVHDFIQTYGAAIAHECHLHVIDSGNDPIERLPQLPRYDQLIGLFGKEATSRIISQCMHRVTNSRNALSKSSDDFLNYYLSTGYSRAMAWRYVIKRIQYGQIRTAFKIALRMMLR
jgi:glycosyltransferase involved in cell wall biosynthesis